VVVEAAAAALEEATAVAVMEATPTLKEVTVVVVVIEEVAVTVDRGKQNTLAEDMHQAVIYLSQQLYSKDVHFLTPLPL
jgi:hypothetical protein